jgi:hypothetical protein
MRGCGMRGYGMLGDTGYQVIRLSIGLLVGRLVGWPGSAGRPVRTVCVNKFYFTLVLIDIGRKYNLELCQILDNKGISASIVAVQEINRWTHYSRH